MCDTKFEIKKNPVETVTIKLARYDELKRKEDVFDGKKGLIITSSGGFFNAKTLTWFNDIDSKCKEIIEENKETMDILNNKLKEKQKEIEALKKQLNKSIGLNFIYFLKNFWK